MQRNTIPMPSKNCNFAIGLNNGKLVYRFNYQKNKNTYKVFRKLLQYYPVTLPINSRAKPYVRKFTNQQIFEFNPNLLQRFLQQVVYVPFNNNPVLVSPSIFNPKKKNN